MNYIYLLLFFYFLCYSCQGQRNEKTVKMTSINKIQYMDATQYYEYMKILNFKPDTFNKKQFDKEAEFGKYIYTDNLGNKVIESGGEYFKSIGEDESEYIQVTILRENPLLSLYKEFYPNCIIKRKSLYFLDNNSIGVTQEFDRNGKMIREINEDKKYNNIRYRDIISFLIKENLYNDSTKEIKGELSATFIKKEKNNQEIKQLQNKDVWIIKNFISPPTFENIYYIDAQTGDILSHLYKGKEMMQDKKTSGVYKTYKGKSYTQKEWEEFEQKLFEEYAGKHNISLTKNDQKNNKGFTSRFLPDD
jgi:hypothetical protein